MKKTVLLTCLLIFSSFFNINAQTDSTLYKWEPSLTAGLNFSQVSFSDWAKGGDNAIAWNTYLNFGLNWKSEHWSFKNQLRVIYGRTQTGDQPDKQNENEIFMENVLARDLGWIFKFAASNTFLTQITAGYNYKVDPAVQISNFFDPAYITQGIGLLYDKSDVVQTRLDIAAREIISDKFFTEADDPNTPEIETFKFDFGFNSVTDLKLNVAENVQYVSKLSLFSPFKRMDIWDIRWENLITARINKWLATNLNVVVVYDEDQIKRTQVREAFQLGLVFTIF
ncbi:MAG: DUF3078 domain-containing protein [Ignavibacteriales bacterium]|uniref:DUF3078 domain-containing protein n=1 Tax=Kuenenia stuttgartiensis TaxID=174633 RepID=UPI00132B6DFF|nr:DUF3078 domain-containing protein [Candidatus Kuenenia stuttgartiensis]KAB2907193.1 MAG: DUF3078 domain-containing protein [Ignavibacteriaceae bacterium]MBW7873253.1 DUF3078 domain-containing protein [Ignavibacteria bacterium]MCZ2142991.1 DUF3078 domain-containing protein [Ignavibacteriales bacterium]OQY76408.1 MAG: hypothetical protein B6D45_03555 [Ignavibacteriales bacterium UTCHB3]MBV6444680.1 hypothetical protein [Ignavibacteriaceae bacterium]